MDRRRTHGVLKPVTASAIRKTKITVVKLNASQESVGSRAAPAS
jgi:hypothetical protein